ncbi:MAG: ATP-binding protein [Sedimentibacter sp.]|uniref:sensor histidine kinase n=1 Tax=Sedimentibacter sp. TaxID=1960295 RepID=UPI00298220CC|nr:ATP-binding protein [Sedimentibacter sp.]MDW5299926.1 ATP-binding protein [Sedimentibacter sp.]
MISKLVRKLGIFFKDKSDESKILVTYRFISFFITSMFYILNNPEHGLIRKMIIIGCLSVSSLILSYLYPIYEKSQKSIKVLLIIEIIGNILLLVPSGGIKSPFIWYSLNTILISFIFLKDLYGWINFFIYFLCYGIIMKYFTDNNIYILKFLKDESNLFLSFIMIIVAIQVLAIFIRKAKEESLRLKEANIQLEIANKMILESIDHIKELYQSVNILTNQGNREGIIKFAFEHIKRITKTNIVFYYDINSNKMLFSEENYLLKTTEEHILKELNKILQSDIPLKICILNSKFLIISVSSSYATYGVLGMEANSNEDNIIYSNNAYQLQFLSELISNAFERLTLEEINDSLLITEEQNRIANEIHDTVLQRLFSMSCGMFSLIKNLNNYKPIEITDELNQFREIIDSTMKELRNKIYGLSWKKSGHSSFNLDIKRYIDDIKRLNHVNIPFSIHGSIETLSIEQKKTLYRMICEGIGNAVRHGKAKNIEIKLNITSEYTNLSIIDDGIGFDLKNVMKASTNGIGIQNLNQLTEILHGEINMESELNSGTTINVTLPNTIQKGAAAL